MLLLISLVLFSTTVFAFYSHTDAVTELTDSDFNNEVFGSGEPWMIEFYAPWCGHCRNLAPAYLKAAENVQGLVRMGAVDCDVHKQVCGRFGIRGFPTLKLFPHDGRSENDANDYQGARSAAAIAKAVLGMLPNLVSKLTNEKARDKFFQSDLDKVILFSDKTSTADLFKSLAVQFKGRLVFGQAHTPKQSELAAEYGVEKSPHLVVVKGGSEPVVYDGKLKHKDLHKWLSGHAPPPAKRSGSKSSKKAEKKEPEGPPPPPPQDEVWRLDSKADLQEKCLERPGICAVALLDSYAPDDEKKAQHAILEELLASHGGAKGGFTITYLDPLDQEDWMKPFGFGQLAASDLPRLLILNQKRGYFHGMIGAFSTEKIGQYFNSVRRGSVKVQKLPENHDYVGAFKDQKKQKTEL